eukprot:scaffold52703_cov51-Phaeocystis_antarctica.AAC.2
MLQPATGTMSHIFLLLAFMQARFLRTIRLLETRAGNPQLSKARQPPCAFGAPSPHDPQPPSPSATMQPPIPHMHATPLSSHIAYSRRPASALSALV